MTAMPSWATGMVVRPSDCSCSFNPREDVAISAVPFETASMPADEPRPLTSTPVPVSSLKSSAACSAMGRQVVEPATVMDSVTPPVLHAVSVKIVDTETAAVEMTSGMRRRTCGPGPSVL